MKIIYIIFALFMISARVAFAQDDVEKALADATSAYDGKNLQDARFALEQSLQAIDVVIGKEILKLLPTELDPFACDVNEDNVVGGSGGLVGLNVSRYYKSKKDSVSTFQISIINNSPMIATINAYMTNPMFMNSSDGSQKIVRVAGYKAVLNKRTDDNKITGYEIQMPFNQSLMTFTADGVTNENDMLALAEKVDIKGIVKLAGGGN
jgi:hypothetical protein